jgi:Translation initiation factor IF-2, N-terminal region
MADLSPDYSKRGYLLPPGCKDLIDVLDLQKRQNISAGKLHSPVHLPTLPVQDFTVELKASTTVNDLAEILHEKPFRVIAALMELGVFANISQIVDFDSAAKLLTKFGVRATKAT